MISKCSIQIVKYLIGSGIIAEEDAELYTYGFFVFLSYIFFFCIVLLWGALFKTLLENVLLYFLFTVLRGYAGGFHASSEKRCTMYTIVALFLSSLGIKFLNIINRPVIAFATLIAGSLIIFLLSPLDTPAKPLNEEERRHFRKITRTILTIICMASFSFAIYQKYAVMYASTICIILESILVLLGKILHNHLISQSAV